MLQLKRKKKNKDGQEVKHQDHFRCTMKCGFCDKRMHYEDEYHIKRRESEKHKKAEQERCKTVVKGGGAVEGGLNPGGSEGKGNPGGRRSSGPTLLEEEHPTPYLRVSCRVRNGQQPPRRALVAPTRAGRTPRSAAKIGALSACRPLGLRSSSLKRDRRAAPRMTIWFS